MLFQNLIRVNQRTSLPPSSESRQFLRALNASCKRIFDVILASIVLAVASPLMALIALLVWLDSPGNVIFSQERLGFKGKHFRMYKFRKFQPTWGDQGPGVTVRNDVRMTRIGAFLECTKLDELPQFWNVLKGDMSLVGPRPESPRFAVLYEGDYAKLLDYLPGIFGPCQVKFRNESEYYTPKEDPESFYRRVLFPQKANIDLEYFKRANFLSDLLLIVQGTWVSIAGIFNWRRFIHLNAKIIALDALLIALAWFMANALRFAGLPLGRDFVIMIEGFIVIPSFLVAMLVIAGAYRLPLYYFSLLDAIRLVARVTISTIVVFLLMIGLHRNISFYLLPLVIFILITILALPRVLSRISWSRRQPNKCNQEIRVMLYGAGRAGLSIVNWIGNGNILGFLDDEPNLKGKMIQSKRVFGHESDIQTVFQVYPFDELWLTFQPSNDKLDRLVTFCERKNVRLFVLPQIEPFSNVLLFGH